MSISRPAPPRAPAPASAGFTMLELVIVLVLIGILFSFLVPNLGGLTPKYRLRSYSRTVAGAIERARVIAIVKGKTTGIRYVLDDPSGGLVMLLPPAPEEYPDQSIDEREGILRYECPTGVRIRSILVPGGHGAMTSGVVNLAFSPNGITGSHIVVLEANVSPNAPPAIIALKYNSISGILDYYNEEVDFQHFEG